MSVITPTTIQHIFDVYMSIYQNEARAIKETIESIKIYSERKEDD